MWDVGCGMWDVGIEMWDVGWGIHVQRGKGDEKKDCTLCCRNESGQLSMQYINDILIVHLHR
jgi:hypothetical protein